MSRKWIAAIVWATFLVGGASACDFFRVQPAAAPQYLKSEGWTIPGLDGSLSAPRETNLASLSVRAVMHAEPYVAEFPAATFHQGDKVLTMSPQTMRVEDGAFLRYEIGGKVVAYTFRLIPVAAHRGGGQWVIDAEAGCVFHATYVDDKGDGKFRLLVPEEMTIDLIPAWAMKPKS